MLVDYAHTPDALANVLDAAREIAQGRLVCVFGCGGDRDRAKRPLMGARPRELADALVVTSDNPRAEEPEAIIDEILAGSGRGPGVEVEPDRRAAIRAAIAGRRRRRRRRDRRQGARAGADLRRPHRPLLRRRGGARTLSAASSSGRGVIPLALAEVARLCPGGWRSANGAMEATGLEIDSRRIRPGDLFVAIRGGVDFLDDALARGAAAALVPDERARVDGGARAGGARPVARPGGGVTGSTGKTSTKDILAALCRPHLRTVAAEQSHNNEIGLPLTLTRIEPDTEIVDRRDGDARARPGAELCRDRPTGDRR